MLREALLYVFFVDRSKVFQSDRKSFHEGTGIFFPPNFFGFRFHFHCFCGAAVPCWAFSFVIYTSTYSKHIKRGKGLPYLGYVRTYGM